MSHYMRTYATCNTYVSVLYLYCSCTMTKEIITMITATKLRNNVYGILDEVLSTGIPVDIERHGKHLRIVALDKPLKLKNLKPIKNLIVGDPADLEKIDWSDEWKP